MLPAPVMPEVLLGRTPNPTLERARVRGDDAVHVGIERAGLLDLHLLEVEGEPPTRLPERAGEEQRRTQAKRENGRPARGLRVTPEKRHPRGGETHRSLVDEERHRMLLPQGPRDAAYRVGVVDHRHPDASAGL